MISKINSFNHKTTFHKNLNLKNKEFRVIIFFFNSNLFFYNYLYIQWRKYAKLNMKDIIVNSLLN